MVGFDSGFFGRLLTESQAKDSQSKHAKVVSIWQKTVALNNGVVSCISLYELRKLALRGILDKAQTEYFLERLPKICSVVWLDDMLMKKAAYLSHSVNLAMADALILQSLLDGGASTVYTTDNDLTKYKLGPKIIRLS
ncbi:MAG: type II toxin-antitoxin system VapC family toxin [Trueperaceae bacterium]